MHGLGPAALRLRQVHAVAGAVVWGLLALAVDVVVRLAGSSPPVPVGVLPLAVAVVAAGAGLALAVLVHRSWRWSLEADHLRVERGVVVRRTSLIPRRRVQHISTHVGPLQRQLDLATLEVHTAGARTPNVLVQHLEAPVARSLRDELAAGAVPDAARAR